MENIEIKRVSTKDIISLQEIGRKTFAETFSESNTAENMTKYLEEGFAANKLLEEIKQTDSEFYFANVNGNVVGYLKLNTGQSQTEMQDHKALEIERIYVLAAYHGKKIGQLLYEKAMEVSTKVKSNYVWLGVWEKNVRAIRFYEKNGFIAFDKHIFKLGDDDQVDIMMKKIL
ncbi:GNAT family N-acetyltransferase [Flavobacterium olei]|uniref:GNAT family N-acetyltransferase n=1 Tax=Flavobacterium olei TaxID=1886782 RepID=UPI00321AB4AE